jgi:hypothetical protein
MSASRASGGSIVVEVAEGNYRCVWMRMCFSICPSLVQIRREQDDVSLNPGNLGALTGADRVPRPVTLTQAH